MLHFAFVFSVMAVSGLFAFQAKASGLLDGADIGYGEYLSGECVTCHRATGAAEGIPSIIGLEAEGFVAIMRSYRAKELDNPVMQIVAGRLDDEQIASLAVYFSSLD